MFDQRELSFNLGEGPENNIPDGVEQALLKFKKSERSLLKLTPAYGFGATGNEQLGVPANANLEYEIELKSFEKAKESWSMDADEKLEQAKLCKEKGTNHFKAAKYSLANKQYAKIVTLLEFEKSNALKLVSKFVAYNFSINQTYSVFSSQRRKSHRERTADAGGIFESSNVLLENERLYSNTRSLR